eukprot:TRINITY_DN2507_c0_g1_i1.p1 TRINITY_DN2507_c0_g1~~TRINITY_DN2507_c0_g1_i1.p1  ORF type:complete len:1083 (+),score=162.41 TRINITY_DN2507_c0_g1_i1:25-3249(+)
MGEYKLNIDFYNYDDSVWQSITSVEDIVSEVKLPPTNQKGLFKALSTVKQAIPKRDPKSGVLVFLYDNAKKCIEDPKLKIKPLPSICSLYLTFSKLLDHFKGIKSLDFDIENWSKLLEVLIRIRLNEILLAIESDMDSLRTHLKNINEQQSSKKMVDISELLLDISGHIDAPRYVMKFNEQLAHNNNTLRTIDHTLQRNHFDEFVKFLKYCSNQNIPQIFSHQSQNLQVQLLYPHIMSIRNEISSLLGACQERAEFCRSIFLDRNIDLSIFEHSKISQCNSFRKNRKKFISVYDNPESQLTFPMSVPNLSPGYDNLILCNSLPDFERLKKLYLNSKSDFLKLERAIPKRWPQTLPNLSTVDTKPSIKVKSQEDYQLILSCYSSYISCLDRWCHNWTKSITKLVEFLDTTSEFYQTKSSLSSITSSTIYSSGSNTSGGGKHKTSKFYLLWSREKQSLEELEDKIFLVVLPELETLLVAPTFSIRHRLALHTLKLLSTFLSKYTSGAGELLQELLVLSQNSISNTNLKSSKSNQDQLESILKYLGNVNLSLKKLIHESYLIVNHTHIPDTKTESSFITTFLNQFDKIFQYQRTKSFTPNPLFSERQYGSHLALQIIKSYSPALLQLKEDFVSVFAKECAARLAPHLKSKMSENFNSINNGNIASGDSLILSTNIVNLLANSKINSQNAYQLIDGRVIPSETIFSMSISAPSLSSSQNSQTASNNSLLWQYEIDSDVSKFQEKMSLQIEKIRRDLALIRCRLIVLGSYSAVPKVSSPPEESKTLPKTNSRSSYMPFRTRFVLNTPPKMFTSPPVTENAKSGQLKIIGGIAFFKVDKLFITNYLNSLTRPPTSITTNEPIAHYILKKLSKLNFRFKFGLVSSKDTQVDPNIAITDEKSITNDHVLVVDASDLDLSGIDFSYTNLEGISFARTNLDYANFDHCNISHCSFVKSSLYQTSFNQAILNNTFIHKTCLFSIFPRNLTCINLHHYGTFLEQTHTSYLALTKLLDQHANKTVPITKEQLTSNFNLLEMNSVLNVFAFYLFQLDIKSNKNNNNSTNQSSESASEPIAQLKGDLLY